MAVRRSFCAMLVALALSASAPGCATSLTWKVFPFLPDISGPGVPMHSASGALPERLHGLELRGARLMLEVEDEDGGVIQLELEVDPAAAALHAAAQAECDERRARLGPWRVDFTLGPDAGTVRLFESGRVLEVRRVTPSTRVGLNPRWVAAVVLTPIAVTWDVATFPLQLLAALIFS